jgi:hypothetical protein
MNIHAMFLNAVYRLEIKKIFNCVECLSLWVTDKFNKGNRRRHVSFSKKCDNLAILIVIIIIM